MPATRAASLSLLTPDARFRFGNAPVVVGREAIRAAVAGFFAAIASSRHQLLATWNGSGTAVCEGKVTYTRHDGSMVSVPFANVFELRGDKIAAYRIYIDNSSLFAALLDAGLIAITRRAVVAELIAHRESE